MYDDPADIRKHFYKLSLNDNEMALLRCAAAKRHLQLAEAARVLIMEKAVEIFKPDQISGVGPIIK